MARKPRSRKSIQSTDINDVLDPEGEMSADDLERLNKITELAQAIDALISVSRVTNIVAVNTLSILLRHATAQMYSSAYGRPDLHDAIAEDIEPDFFALLDTASKKADFMVKAADLTGDMKGQLPN